MSSSEDSEQEQQVIEELTQKFQKKLEKSLGKQISKIIKEHDNRTPKEKERDNLRCKIDTLTYKRCLEDIDQQLELEHKKAETELIDELDLLEHSRKKRKITKQIDLLDSKISLKQKQGQWKTLVEKPPEYLENPVKKGENGEVELVISDRVIEMSGVITYKTSEYISDRIHFFNNQDEKMPIFLIIDYCPGGSVMSGYRIYEAMISSPAPIYVVVKSFAASMAAMIASLADHSFIYRNGIMLHHQILTKTSGNLKQHKEQVKQLEEWFRRLAEPLSNKLGISIQQFIDRMYENSSDGDWQEFGDKAVELGWIQQVVDRVRQTNYQTDPNLVEIQVVREERSEKYALMPMDSWWLYDPENYYKVE